MKRTAKGTPVKHQLRLCFSHEPKGQHEVMAYVAQIYDYLKVNRLGFVAEESFVLGELNYNVVVLSSDAEKVVAKMRLILANLDMVSQVSIRISFELEESAATELVCITR